MIILIKKVLNLCSHKIEVITKIKMKKKIDLISRKL